MQIFYDFGDINMRLENKQVFLGTSLGNNDGASVASLHSYVGTIFGFYRSIGGVYFCFYFVE